MIRAAAPRVAWLLAAIAAFAAAPACAQAAGPDDAATPQPSSSVRDPDFGVVARHFGLERRVEMFQWRESAAASGGYERAWSDAPVDASGFAPGHDNPPFPLQGRRWLAPEVRVDGLPLDPAVVEALGRWVPFRPSFSALPANLAATFQPQGDGLGTAENPMAPQVGDLRVHWRELRLPPLAGRIEPADGRWRLKAAAGGGARAAGDAPVEGVAAPHGGIGAGWFAALLLVAVVAAGALLASRRRR